MENTSIWGNKTEPKKSLFSKKRIFWGLLFILLISALAFGLFLLSRRNNLSEILPENIPAETAPEQAVSNTQALPVLEEENGLTEKYQSENFRISQISFGGDASLVAGDSEKLPIEIFGVKAEPFLNEKDNDSKIAISWKSNKLTASELTYSLAGGGKTETAKENDFGFNHNIILSSLEAGSPYVFSIKSYDRWGNSKPFGYYGAYSSAKADSIFELIGRTFGETFGWALNR